MKVVINTCYGGFSISNKPIQVYIQRRASGQWLTGFCTVCKVIGYDKSLNRTAPTSPLTLPGRYARARITDHG